MAQGMLLGMLFFQTLNFQIRNSFVFSPDDTTTSCSACDPLDEMRSIIDRDIARLEKSIHWRSTALSAPELWAEIPLRLPRR